MVFKSFQGVIVLLLHVNNVVTLLAGWNMARAGIGRGLGGGQKRQDCQHSDSSGLLRLEGVSWGPLPSRCCGRSGERGSAVDGAVSGDQLLRCLELPTSFAS